jgi:hypothetical protein
MKLNCYTCGTILDIDFDDYLYTNVNSFCPRCGSLIDNLLSPEQVEVLKERLAMAEDDIKNGRYKTSEEVFKDMRKKIREMKKSASKCGVYDILKTNNKKKRKKRK